MAGQSAYDSEEMAREDLVQEALDTLALIHPQIKHIPKPIETVVTRWSRDEFAKGSYSFVGRDGTGEDYDLLAKSVDDQLYFAGEATSRHYPATAHGAYLSGIKVAKEVLDSLIGPQTLDAPSTTAEIKSVNRGGVYSTGKVMGGARRRRRESSESSNESDDSHLLTLEEAHTTNTPPPEKTENVIGHGFAVPRRRGRAATSMIARFKADQSDADGDDDEEYLRTASDNGRKKKDSSDSPRKRGRPRKFLA